MNGGSWRVIVWVLLLAGSAVGQDAMRGRLGAVREHAPAGVSLTVSAAKTRFFLGELIPLKLSFRADREDVFVADSRLEDRLGSLNGAEEFRVTPANAVEDPLRGLSNAVIGIGGLSAGDAKLGAKPFVVERILNDWVRFRKPGTYRVAVVSRRVRTGAPNRTGGMPVELASNVLTLEMAAAPEAWVKQQIAEAERVLDAPLDPNQDAYERRLRAGLTLRHLDTLAASLALLRYATPKPGDSGEGPEVYVANQGILSSPFRKELLPAMEARLVAPDQPVTARYVDTLARLAALEADGGAGTFDREKYTARLAGAMPKKEAAARAVSLDSLREIDRAAAWVPETAAAVIRDFPTLPARLQSQLLASDWEVLRDPAMLPVLRAIVEHPPEPRVNPPIQDTAVRRIYDLAPEEGRRLILAEIAKPDSFLTQDTLTMLPDPNLPALNETLAARLEAGGFDDGLIVRYATGDIVTRVEKAYLARQAEQAMQNLPHCGGPLIYYFLRYDEAFGEKELRRELTTPGEWPACYNVAFQFYSLGRYAYSPALERLAIEFLTSPEVPVKSGAAELLGKYGSPAAEKPLWDTMAYFHEWWTGKEAELQAQSGQENVQLERALRMALAQASGWALDEPGYARLRALCVSGWCQQEVNEWQARASPH